MARLAISVLLAVSGIAAQDSVPYERLRQVADLVSCLCGCASSVGGCNMLNCHFGEPIKAEIRAGLAAGQSDAEVLEAVYAKHGPETRVQPKGDAFGLLGWIAPFASLLAGVAVIPWVIRRWRRASAHRSRGSEVPDEVVERYRAQIEGNLEELE